MKKYYTIKTAGYADYMMKKLDLNTEGNPTSSWEYSFFQYCQASKQYIISQKAGDYYELMEELFAWLNKAVGASNISYEDKQIFWQTDNNYAGDATFMFFVYRFIIPILNHQHHIDLNPAALQMVYQTFHQKLTKQSFQRAYKIALKQIRKQGESKIANPFTKYTGWLQINGGKSEKTYPQSVINVNPEYSNYKLRQHLLWQLSQGCGWCTGQGVQKTYLPQGDFWMYLDNGKAKIAIRTQGGHMVGKGCQIQGLHNKNSNTYSYAKNIIQLANKYPQINIQNHKSQSNSYNASFQSILKAKQMSDKMLSSKHIQLILQADNINYVTKQIVKKNKDNILFQRRVSEIFQKQCTSVDNFLNLDFQIFPFLKQSMIISAKKSVISVLSDGNPVYYIGNLSQINKLNNKFDGKLSDVKNINSVIENAKSMMRYFITHLNFKHYEEVNEFFDKKLAHVIDDPIFLQKLKPNILDRYVQNRSQFNTINELCNHYFDNILQSPNIYNMCKVLVKKQIQGFHAHDHLDINLKRIQIINQYNKISGSHMMEDIEIKKSIAKRILIHTLRFEDSAQDYIGHFNKCIQIFSKACSDILQYMKNSQYCKQMIVNKCVLRLQDSDYLNNYIQINQFSKSIFNFDTITNQKIFPLAKHTISGILVRQNPSMFIENNKKLNNIFNNLFQDQEVMHMYTQNSLRHLKQRNYYFLQQRQDAFHNIKNNPILVKFAKQMYKKQVLHQNGLQSQLINVFGDQIVYDYSSDSQIVDNARKKAMHMLETGSVQMFQYYNKKHKNAFSNLLNDPHCISLVEKYVEQCIYKMNFHQAIKINNFFNNKIFMNPHIKQIAKNMFKLMLQNNMSQTGHGIHQIDRIFHFSQLPEMQQIINKLPPVVTNRFRLNYATSNWYLKIK